MGIIRLCLTKEPEKTGEYRQKTKAHIPFFFATTVGCKNDTLMPLSVVSIRMLPIMVAEIDKHPGHSNIKM